MEIMIFSVGGTIDKIYFDDKSDYEVGQPMIREILEESNVSFRYRVESLMRKDSLQMTDADRDLVRRRVAASPHRHILITHGTDTMVETARVLRSVEGKVIVLTGAMSPARFKSSDAGFNVGVAVCGLQTLGDGVYIAMNGRIFDPERIRKNRRKNRFEEI